MMKYIVTLLLNMLLISTINADQPINEYCCLDKIKSYIKIGDEINVVLTDSTKHVGRLISVNDLDQQFKMGFFTRQGISEIDFSTDQIDYLTYRKTGKIRSGTVILGILAGGLIGHFLEYVVFDPHTEKKFPFDEMTHRGSFWGLVGGAAIGSIVSLSTSTELKIRCNF